MTILTSPLRALRKIPEPWKRRLRPVLVRVVHAVGAVRGAPVMLRLMQRLAPGLYGWMARRYRYYVNAGIAAPRLPVGPLQEDADVRLALAGLRHKAESGRG